MPVYGASMHDPYADQHVRADVAESYDTNHARHFAPDELGPAVELLAELAGDGPVLEFAIGTGRVALPLIARGLHVSGIDISEAMVGQLRAKPGGADVPITLGDMSTTIVGQGFSLVYLVFNTIGNLTTQDAQVDCFANAAAHLRPGGRFLIETGMPLPPGSPPLVFGLEDNYVGIDEYVDPVNQIHVSHHWQDLGDRLRRVSGRFRWAWPAEFDLMARLAGLRLEDRWANWNRSPFTGTSERHVSVWTKPVP